MAFAKDSTLERRRRPGGLGPRRGVPEEKQMVELALNVAWYNSGVRLMGALSIDLEESYR